MLKKGERLECVLGVGGEERREIEREGKKREERYDDSG